MAKLTAEQKSFLGRYGARVSFEKNERMLYGHDIAAIPRLIEPLLGNTTPDAVVQPVNEQELVDIVSWAYENGVPLTPRGKATSGYGGAIPLKKGVVIDFYRMREIIALNKTESTVTVQPGITWKSLDQFLKQENLTLRLYPSSYPSATVGGWLAQGGAGFGSYEFGYIHENIVSARAVLPDGSVRVFTGDDLLLIADAEGTTGCISEITLSVQPLEEIEVIGICFKKAENIQHLAESIIEKNLPIWSISFINDHMAKMRNDLPLREHYGHPVEERVVLPAGYIAIIAFRKKDSPAITSAVTGLAQSLDAALLPHALSRHEWENRFFIMKIKRLGPSLVPAEFIVPLNRLGAVMNELETAVRRTMVKEGLIIRKGKNGVPEVVILGFIPSDERSISYTVSFSLVLSAIKIAEKSGGRAYATGMYFPHKAASLLGNERLRKLALFKKQNDPRGILNPGKVLQPTPISLFIKTASLFEPLGRIAANMLKTPVGERIRTPQRGIPADVAWYAYACSQCGYCVDDCDQFYGRGWESQSPRGKWYWLRQYMRGRCAWDQTVVDTFVACTTCELCNLRCCAALPIEQSWMKLRGKLIHEEKKMTFPPFEMMGAALSGQGNIWAGYRKNRDAWFPPELKQKHGAHHQAKYVYFAGCTASYVEQDIAIASVHLLDKAGVDFTYLGEKENCCATPMLVAGKWDLFVETMKKNIAAVKESGADTVINSCPACDMMWRQVYPHWAQKLGIDYTISSKHYSEIVAEKIRDGSFVFPKNSLKPVTVTWHDSCHIGRVSGVYQPPRDIIKAIPNVTLKEMKHCGENAHCCGSVLTLIKEPAVAAEIGKMRLDEAREAGAEKVLALCPCCQFQLRVAATRNNMPVEIVDLANFAASALGCSLPDPNPEVKAQWAVFEAMIALMTPKGFAELMSTMWPELIAAMPLGMGPMMRFFGKIPGALNLMKPLFPVLFPLLLPKMMPKVMPTMLCRVKDRVPMPDYMAEQMPVLMPQVMNNLMPHMIKDVVLLVTDPMITYLQGKG